MSDPLRVLEVLDRMEVGPVRVERRRLIAPYVVVRGGRRRRTELIYRYEQDVFDPLEPGSRNLASMIAAQVALNYGLFCREMVFRGEYDAADRDFLETFAENTAREIYVNKFLHPNPFLTGPAGRLPAIRRERILRARLRFRDTPARAGGSAWRRAAGSGGHAVLSSGGKDSLLSFGLLEEMGREPHAIFVNESGRHWYTALNAYRHLAASRPATTRVWTNADRLFTWMLRQLPFVRADFARVRSDQYPIRLWTVAVFLFGALPLLRARGIDRLVVGDEYDTTVRRVHRGIRHWGGLYDQSIAFDRAVTRYFRRKGWGVVVFSLLRSMSELLIEKILWERYPELQRQQISCHATHLVGGRAVPCGECEKCRRVVGMLVAVGADPGRCGYAPAQVRRCLLALDRQELHQESAAAEHLLFLLAGRGLLEGPGPGGRRRRPHPEILSLRFDPRRSPPEAVPPDLRRDLLRIGLRHARGAVERRGRLFTPCDPAAGSAS